LNIVFNTELLYCFQHLILLFPQAAIGIILVDVFDEHRQQRYKQDHDNQFGYGVKQRKFCAEFQILKC